MHLRCASSFSFYQESNFFSCQKFFSRQDVDQRVGSLRVFESPGKGVDMIRFLFVSVAFVTLILFPIVAEADGHLDLNTDLRLRWEYSSPWDPGEPGDTVTMMRTHVGMNTDFTDNIHFMLGVLDSRSLSGQDDPEIGDGVPGVHQVHVQVADLSRLHESLGFLAGWSLGLGRSELPNYGNGRIIHSAEWSNVGPATADGYHLASQFLDGALDLNIHYLTLAKDPTGAAGSGDHFYGAHLDVDSLPFIEASFYYWKYRADLANAAAAAANGLADPGSSDEDTYGYLFTLRDGIIPRVGVTFEYALQDGNRYDALDDGAIQKLDSLYFAFEGTYDMPQMAGFWDMTGELAISWLPVLLPEQPEKKPSDRSLVLLTEPMASRMWSITVISGTPTSDSVPYFTRPMWHSVSTT